MKSGTSSEQRTEAERGDRLARLLVDSVQDYAIFMLDPEGRVRTWNRGAERMKGYSEEEIVGEHFSLFYPPEDRERAIPQRALQEAQRNGRVEAQGWRVRKDGTRFWANVVITSVRGDEGELVGFAKVTRDVTERKRLEEEREQALASEQTTRKQVTTILESITDAFFAVDDDWRFTYVNTRAEELLNRRREEILGESLWEAFPEAVGSTFEEMYHRAVDEGRSVEFEEYYEPLGRWFEVKAYPSAEGLSVYFHDVTERKRSEEAVREREQQLRAVLEVLPLPVFIAEASGRVAMVNRAVREFWGEGAPTPDTPDEYVEYKGWWPDTGRPIGAREWALARALEAKEAVGPEEVEIETFDGERKTILNFARPIVGEDGHLSGAVAVSVDITQRKATEESERFLADAGRALSSSLDYEETLRRVARLAVSRIADWCIVYVRSNGAIHRLAIAGSDPEKERQAQERTGDEVVGDTHPLQEVFRTGESRLFEEVPGALLESTATDNDHLEFLRSLGFRSVMMVPLLARGEVLGAIAFGAAESGRRYDAADLSFAERLADRAAAAVENARLFREAQQRASEEEALRRAAGAVAEAFTIDEVIRQIADRALDATRADGAFVERLDVERGEVELVAAAGRCAPSQSSRAAYAGSVAQAVLERGEALVLENAGESDSVVLRELARQCGPCSAMAVPLADAGEPIGCLVLVRSLEHPPFRPDESARAQTFGELASLAFRKIHLLDESERRREQLERVTESRAGLVRGFSHDLKNPLGAADGYLALLEDETLGELAEKQKHSVVRVRRLVRAALELIDHLVEFHRAEAGQIPIEVTPLEMRDAAREITEEYRPQGESKGLTMELEMPDRVPVIESDSSRVRQILGNLISNAVKYTERGGVSVRVRFGALPGAPGPGEWLAVDVADTGPGIPVGEQHRLFQEFTRLSSEGTHGAGLGLAISQRVADALGGTITVASDEGRGSVFTLWLPLRLPSRDGAGSR